MELYVEICLSGVRVRTVFCLSFYISTHISDTYKKSCYICGSYKLPYNQRGLSSIPGVLRLTVAVTLQPFKFSFFYIYFKLLISTGSL
jgi:hypothetical protein